MENNRVLSPDENGEEYLIKNLRPKSIDEYIGQDDIKKSLNISIKAALKRKETLDHILLAGPPGLGKTTLSNIIAHELSSNIYITSGPVIEKQGDLAAMLTQLERGDVLFIDEIHRLGKSVEEILYSAMEDFQLDIMIGKGPSARSIRIEINPFTLVGATTRSGLIGAPLRNRFGMILEIDFYDEISLKKIINRSSNILDVEINSEAAELISKISRGTPRIANRILRRVRDMATVDKKNVIDIQTVKKTMDILGIDMYGLDNTDRKILNIIIKNYYGGPVGIKAVSASTGIESETISEVYEPYLLQRGFLIRTQRGRCATEKAYKHLRIKYEGKNTSLW
ncbi:MAG: holliday junction helicase RuvB [Kosmotogales bacterium]|nr:holliday junction helicase RuvB [Kosmotogales bacterium]